MWRTIRLVLLLVVVAALIGGVLLGMRGAAFNDKVSTEPFLSSALFGPLRGEDRVNVLLIGYGGEEHSGPYLADSIQILSIDPATDTMTAIPIPRDLWVEGIAAYPQNGKINEVFSNGHADGGLEGGGDLLAEVVSEITGLQVDRWLSIDFDGFRDIVDAVGGVTINNPVAFSYGLNSAQHQSGNWVGEFPAGELHLDGEEALMYSRARFTSVQEESTDFARSVRRARVLAALRKEVGGGGIGSLLPGLRLMDAMEDRIFTNLSAIDLFLLSSHLSADHRVPITDATILVATTNTIGQYILIPNDWTGPGAYGGLRAFIASELANPSDAD